MALKKDNIWLNRFELFKEYVEEFHRFPPPLTIYKGFKIGQWFRNQQLAYKNGFLPENRIKMLNEFHPAWKGNKLERKAANKTLLITSDWKAKVPKGNTPLDLFLKDTENITAFLRDQIYDCETLIEHWKKFYNYPKTRHEGKNIYDCYNLVIKGLKPEYCSLFHAMLEIPKSDVYKTKDMFNRFNLISKNTFEDFVSESLACIKKQNKDIIVLRFGLKGEKKHTLSQTGIIINRSVETVRVNEKATLNLLRVKFESLVNN